MERYLSIPLWGDPPAFSTSLWLRVSVAGSPKLRMLRTRPGLTWGNATHSSHGRPSRSQRIIVNPTSKPRYRSTYRGQWVGALSGVALGAGAWLLSHGPHLCSGFDASPRTCSSAAPAPRASLRLHAAGTP